MRALAILIVWCSLAAADPRTAPIGFDHMVHDRTIAVNDLPALACTRCHAGKTGLARPDHASCFGAGCHAAPAKGKPNTKLAIAADEVQLCTNCHAESALGKPVTGKLAVAYPPYAIDPDFAVTIGHAKHAPIACAQCHANLDGKQPAAPHARCTPCHDGGAAKGPAMSACETCHIRATGAPEPTRLAQSTLPIAFSHAAHAARSPAGKTCATCHAGVAATNDNDLPRPTAQTCAIAGCHVDPAGKSGGVFGIAAAACSRCHTTAPVRTFHIERPTERFSHAKHAMVNRPCTGCHRLAPATGQPVVAPHEACTNRTCHPDEFGSAKPTICGACHNTTEPWRALAVDRAPAEASEFGATLDHGKHRAACTTCHVLRTATRELRTPRGHASCTGTTCHAIGSGPAPQLAACAGCHVAGLEATRTRDRETAPWTVRGTFRHTRPHRTRAADDKPVACESCHADLTAVTVLSLAAPAKATCAPCHDGKSAFKLTGTGCNRCHGTGARP